MTLYYDAITNERVISSLVYIDAIDIALSNGEVITLDWDETDISNDGIYVHTRCKGVYFNGEYANGKLSILQDDSNWVIDRLSVYSPDESVTEFTLESLEFEDGYQGLIVTDPIVNEVLIGKE